MMRLPALILSIAFSLSLALVLFAANASASQPTNPHYDRCLENASTQLAMNDCADEERMRADLELRAAWRKVVRWSTDKAKVNKEQRIWRKARGVRCRKEAALHEGGSILPLVYASCLASAARARTSHLRDLLAAPR